ncbi:MAG: hypothetical protein C4562_01095 [Actinobacteria bacterium]|nr:MAG: hypothetical protein C4562_01095 [Actinomycetota bacterium]
MVKRVWSDFYGGMIDLVMVDSIKEIPDDARYKYTEEDTDVSVYVHHGQREMLGDEIEETFYGVKL